MSELEIKTKISEKVAVCKKRIAIAKDKINNVALTELEAMMLKIIIEESEESIEILVNINKAA